MEFCSLGFIFVFLPLAIVCYAFTPGRYRNYALFLINAVYYLMLGWRAAAITLAAALIDYAAALFIASARGRGRIAVFRLPVLIIAAGKNIAGAVLFAVIGELSSTVAVAGFAVYALTATGYLIDVFRSECAAERDPVKFLLFSTFFCKMYIGPLVRYGEIKPQLDGAGGKRRFSLEETGEGLTLFLRGAAKKVLLADRLAEFQTSLAAVCETAPSLLGSWLTVLVFALRIFFELSGFSDMAQGLGLIFGLRLPSNFYYPYQSLGVGDFLRRFNTTVSQFFSHYVYDALRPKSSSAKPDADAQKTPRQGRVPEEILNTLLVCLLFGMWFGVKLNYIVWGVYLALFIVLEKFVVRKALDAMPRLFVRAYSFMAVLISFVIFSGENLRQSAENIGLMFNFSRSATSPELNYLISGNWLLLTLAVLFSFSLFALFGRILRKRAKPAADMISAIFAVALLVLTAAFMI